MGRIFGFLSLILVMGIALYMYSRQVASTSTAAGSPQAAINITGVRSDLVSIAQAERRYMASEGKYGSFDELVSANYITVSRQRPPYSYEVETSTDGFHVIATRTNDKMTGVPAKLTVDENMNFEQSQ